MAQPAKLFTDFEDLLMSTGLVSRESFNAYHDLSKSEKEDYLSRLMLDLDQTLQIVNAQTAGIPVTNTAVRKSNQRSNQAQSNTITMVSHPVRDIGADGAPGRRMVDDIMSNGQSLGAKTELGQAILNRYKLHMSMKPSFTSVKPELDNKLTYAVKPSAPTPLRTKPGF